MTHYSLPSMRFFKFIAIVCLALGSFLPASAWQGPELPLGMHPGFPRTQVTTIDFSSPTVADIDQDGDLEILVGDSRGCVWGFDSNGDVLPNFPFQQGGVCSNAGRISGPLAVGNLDADDHLEIVAGTAGDGVTEGHRGKVFAWNPDGSLLPGWPKEMRWNVQYGSGRPEVSTVALANVNGGAGLEVLAGTTNNSSAGGTDTDPTHNLYVYDAGGSVLNGFPTMWKRAGIFGAIAAGDINQDGCEEILAGRDHRWLHIYDPAGNNPTGWPQETFIDPADRGGAYVEFTRNAPALGDINGDGAVDIVAPGRVKNDGVLLNSAVMVFNQDGSRPSGWQSPKMGDGAPLGDTYDPSQAPALADLDNDGKLEIIVGLTDGSMRAYSSNGDLWWKFKLANNPLVYFSEPVVGDITGDGQLDIVFGAYSPDGSTGDKAGIYALDASGELLPGYPLALTDEGSEKIGIRAAPTLADVDDDSKVEIIAGSWGGALYVWDLDAPFDPALMPWPTGRADNQRTAFVNPSPGHLLGQESIRASMAGPYFSYLPYLGTSEANSITASCP